MEKIELLSPVGSLGMLKAAVSSGADAAYLGMRKFNAREYALNFNKDYLREAVNICKSNNVKLYVAMNTLVKNSEIKEFLGHMKYAYEEGVDAAIIQDPSFIKVIKESFPGLGVHMSTQTGILNSEHANLFSSADRINIARELDKGSIVSIRKHFKKKIEMFVHGALCACISGCCLFSSFMGGRSGNRGKCAQPCRKRYDNIFPLSTKELCLIEKLPDVINMGINSVKIEGRMRTPFYTANTTAVYRQAIDSYYSGQFKITEEMKRRLEDAFSRGFTEGKFSGEEAFNPKNASGTSKIKEVTYEVNTKHVKLEKRNAVLSDLNINEKPSSGKQLIVRVYNEMDAGKACRYADIIAVDMFDDELGNIRRRSRKPIYAV
ncbi:MAG: U32 family peptidase, partial [Nanoarchaeota archaeon]|nr:U32 family peptidase [Nanoarchaeota archaeon]